MLIFKLLGTGILLGLAFFSSFRKINLEKKQLSSLNAWISLLYYIRGQIDCFSLPLCEILARVDPSILNELGYVDGDVTLATLLEASTPCVPQESLFTLRACLSELGKSYREEQVKRCDYYLKQLEKQRDERKTALPSRAKLSVTLNLCLGLGASILLW